MSESNQQTDKPEFHRPLPDLISDDELSAMLNCKPITLRRERHRGNLPAPIKIAGKNYTREGLLKEHIYARQKV